MIDKITVNEIQHNSKPRKLFRIALLKDKLKKNKTKTRKLKKAACSSFPPVHSH